MTEQKLDTMTIEELVERGIKACQAGEKSEAFTALVMVLQLDPKNERAWIWLSGVCARDTERKFCMERVIEINPANEIARSGLNKLPVDIRSESPLPKRSLKSLNSKCTYPGCESSVSKPGYKLCIKHWKETNLKQTNPRVISESQTQYQISAPISATAIGEKTGLSSRKVNRILSELGWIVSEKKGWVVTSQGKTLGALGRNHSQTGIPFVLWPTSIIENKALLNSVADFKGEQFLNSNSGNNSNFRDKYPPELRSTDGHWVRSRAELVIDNWLYMEGIIHAYERRLPIEEEGYCDFYLPNGNVYIEYWGLENDPKYESRMRTKKDLYNNTFANYGGLS